MTRLCLAVAILALATFERSARAATPDDTRFGEIGHPGPDPGEAEMPPPTASVAANLVGHVTYTGARVDVPTSKRFSLIPQAALLHISPYVQGDPTVLIPYLGGGIGVRPSPGWSTEASFLFGPMSHGIESWSALVAVAKELGGDWSKDVAPPLTVQLAGAWNHFRWANGNGPAGETITQFYAQAEALWRVTPRLHVIPRGMVFFYDHDLAGAVGPALGSISVLAQVGVYAPLAMGAARVGYLVGRRVFPFVEAQQIRYAEDIGNGTQVAGGLRLMLGNAQSSVRASVMAMGGVLFNQVSGPLVPPSVNLSRVPVLGTELELAF